MNQPSAKYLELIGLYRHLHIVGEQSRGLAPNQTFNGKSLLPQINRIKRLISATNSRTLLDYGAGKGTLYNKTLQFEGIETPMPLVDYWNLDVVQCFDPGYAPFQKRPERHFDGVICTDVLEHCPEQDIPWIVQDLFRYAQKFVYVSVASYPANKTLPNGENAHCTIKPAAWWNKLFLQVANSHPQKQWEIWVESKEIDTFTGSRKETCYSNIAEFTSVNGAMI